MKLNDICNIINNEPGIDKPVEVISYQEIDKDTVELLTKEGSLIRVFAEGKAVDLGRQQ